jgi:DNA-binding response OmpR family regulator
VVVRLELPNEEGGRTTTRAEHPSRGDAGPDERSGPVLDPNRLARAVEDLIRAIDPTLGQARVEVEVTHGAPAAEAAVSPAVPLRPTRDRRPDLELNLAGRSLTVDGRSVTLTRREFDLLAYLQDHRGIALSRQELMNTVWQTGYLVGDRTIDVHVRRLRIKLGRHADRLSTLRGFGYRLD